MGLFEQFGKWIDRGIERIIGKPKAEIPLPKIELPRPIIAARKALLEERHRLFEEDKPTWQRRMEEAIEKHREEGMEEEELVERYGEENI